MFNIYHWGPSSYARDPQSNATLPNLDYAVHANVRRLALCVARPPPASPHAAPQGISAAMGHLPWWSLRAVDPVPRPAWHFPHR